MANARIDAPPAPSGPRVPPHNLDAERSLLGAMMLRSQAIADAVQIVSADDFYRPAHRHLYEAICGLYAAGEAVDPITVSEELKRASLLDAVGGSKEVVAIFSDAPATSIAGEYARIVEENAILRRLIATAGEIAELGFHPLDDITKTVDTAESMVFDIGQHRMAD